MVTTTSNVGVFDQSQYQALNAMAKKYFMEDPQLNWVPQKLISPKDAPKYKKPIFGASINIQGNTGLSLPQQTMSTPKSHNVYDLEYVQGNIYYNAEDILMEGQYLAQRKQQEIDTFKNNVKQAVFKGVFTGGFDADGLGLGNRLNTGIVEQASLVTNLNGGDSLLDAAGDVYKALTKMVNAIPFRYRDGKTVVIGADDLFVSKARGALFRGATNQISEFDLFLQELSTETFSQNGQKVAPKVIISDSLFLNTVPGTTKTETDTLGTHSRLFTAILDPAILEQAYSRIGIVGEDKINTIQSTVQKWAARVAGCVHDVNGVQYSEQITW